jgi:hypothetical protein
MNQQGTEVREVLGSHSKEFRCIVRWADFEECITLHGLLGFVKHMSLVYEQQESRLVVFLEILVKNHAIIDYGCT